MRRWLGPVAGAAVLVVLARQLGSEPFLRGLAGAGPLCLLVAVLVGAVTTLASAWRWRLVAGGLGLEVTTANAVAACYRSQLLNGILPGGVLGDVHRAVAFGRGGSDAGRARRGGGGVGRDGGAGRGMVGRAARSVAWERGLGQLVQVAVTLLVLRLWLAAVVAVALLGVALWFVRPVGVAVGVVAASAVALAGYAAMFLVAASATGSTPPVGTVLVVLLVAAVPVNLGGWGPREGAAAWAYGVAGLGVDHGVAASVTYGVMALVAALPGALLLAVPAPRVRRA